MKERTHETVDGNVRRWCDFAKRKKLPFLITEMGSFAYGRLFLGERDMEGPASHTCAVSDAQFCCGRDTQRGKTPRSEIPLGSVKGRGIRPDTIQPDCPDE